MNLLSNRDHEDRPWGSFDRFTLNESSTVKIVRVAPGQRLSLQTHKMRSEFWRVIAGMGSVIIGDMDKAAVVGDEFEIPVHTKHRLIAGPTGITVLEIALGEFDEADIDRLEDDFGRPTRYD